MILSLLGCYFHAVRNNGYPLKTPRRIESHSEVCLEELFIDVMQGAVMPYHNFSVFNTCELQHEAVLN